MNVARSSLHDEPSAATDDTPAGLASDAEVDAGSQLVRAFTQSLQSIGGAVTELSSRIEHAVADLPDGQIVMSFPRAGRICAAQILADLDDVPRPLPNRGPTRRRSRRLPRHSRLRQEPGRRVPMGLQL